MKIIFFKRSLTPSFISVLGVVFASGVQAKSPNSHSTKNPYGADTLIDSPGSNDVVLTGTNHFKIVQFTLKSLRKLGMDQFSIFEPFVKERQSSTVVTFAEIFKSADISSTADVMTDTNNNYVYSNTAKNFIEPQGQIAIARFGAPIPYDQGGPIRIIFPDRSVLGKNINAWNWSLSIIRVK
jgi:hypothetical protein